MLLFGAVLFSDKNNIFQRYKETYPDQFTEYIRHFTWEFLSKNTQIIYSDVSYDYINGLYIPNENQFKHAIEYPLKHLIPVKISYYTKENEYYISYDVMLDRQTLKISNQYDMSFDGIILLSLPYKNTEKEINNAAEDKQNLTATLIEYFDTEKIWLLKNQNKKLVFNTEMHLNIKEDRELTKEMYEKGIHIVNNGTSNKKLKDITTIGSINKLLLR